MLNKPFSLLELVNYLEFILVLIEILNNLLDLLSNIKSFSLILEKQYKYITKTIFFK